MGKISNSIIKILKKKKYKSIFLLNFIDFKIGSSPANPGIAEIVIHDDIFELMGAPRYTYTIHRSDAKGYGH